MCHQHVEIQCIESKFIPLYCKDSGYSKQEFQFPPFFFFIFSVEKEKSCPTFVYFILSLSLGFVFSISV